MMNAETLLRRALTALNSTPNFGFSEAGRRTTSYELAAAIDRYFEPRAIVAMAFLSTGRQWVGLGLGRDETAARKDVLDNLIGIPRELFLTHEADHQATILFHHKTLRAIP